MPEIDFWTEPRPKTLVVGHLLRLTIRIPPGPKLRRLRRGESHQCFNSTRQHPAPGGDLVPPIMKFGDGSGESTSVAGAGDAGYRGCGGILPEGPSRPARGQYWVGTPLGEP